jgi:hypothetical protein
MPRTWNVLVPVVGLIAAETAEEAIRVRTAQLRALGLDVYEGMPTWLAAFESGDSGGFSAQGGESEARGNPPFATEDEECGEEAVNHDTVREQTGEDA